MSAFGGFATPGFGAAAYTTEREILWGRDDQHLPLLFRNSIISGAARDAGNTPTTLLRRGLILGRVTATKELEEWDSDAADGTENIVSVLNCELRATDFDANNTDRAFSTLLRGPVIAANILIKGVSLVGHADEFLARRQMHAMGFVFDDDPQGVLAGACFRLAHKTASYTVLDSDNGTLFTNKGASGAVTFTLPATAKKGLEYTFFAVANQNLVVASGTADKMVVFNDAAADSIAFQTASEIIGGAVRVVGDGDLWYAFVNLGAETQTPTIAT
jgi:hypothetical protein